MKDLYLLLSFILDFIKNKKYLSDNIDENYKLCQDICKRLVESTKVPLSVEGLENIPKEGSLLITPNHTTFFDIIALISCIDRTVSFAAATELEKYPILRDYIKAINCILIDRYTEDVTVMKKQLESMENAIKDKGLILFPEGECSYLSDEIKEFKKGGFTAAKKYDTYILPTYIKSENMSHIGKWYIPKEEVKIVFGDPFKVQDVFGKRVSSKQVSEYTREKVLDLKLKV